MSLGSHSILKSSGAVLWGQRGRVRQCSHAYTYVCRACVCRCARASLSAVERVQLLIVGAQTFVGGGEEAPQRGPLSPTLDSACPAVMYSFVHLVRASPVPGIWAGESSLAPDKSTPGGVQPVENVQTGSSHCWAGAAAFSSPLPRGRCVCPRAAREAPFFQECEGACDSRGRGLSPQRSPTGGLPYAQDAGSRREERGCPSWLPISGCLGRQSQRPDCSGFYFSLCP